MANEESKVKEEFILLIAYYVMVLVAMLSTILCTCRRKNDKPLLCCRSKQNTLLNSDYAQCIPTVSLTIFKRKPNNEVNLLSELERNAGCYADWMNKPTIYNGNLSCSIKSCSGYRNLYAQRKAAMLKLDVICEAQQEQSQEAGESFQV